jgi:DUF1009 family protein
MPAPSRFLPADYDSNRPIALVAGRRTYPIALARRMKALDLPCRLIAFEARQAPNSGKASPKAARHDKIGQLGHMLKAMKKLGAGYALMRTDSAGRLFRELHPDLKAIQILAT